QPAPYALHVLRLRGDLERVAGRLFGLLELTLLHLGVVLVHLGRQVLSQAAAGSRRQDHYAESQHREPPRESTNHREPIMRAMHYQPPQSNKRACDQANIMSGTPQ